MLIRPAKTVPVRRASEFAPGDLFRCTQGYTWMVCTKEEDGCPFYVSIDDGAEGIFDAFEDEDVIAVTGYFQEECDD